MSTCDCKAKRSTLDRFVSGLNLDTNRVTIKDIKNFATENKRKKQL